MKQQRQKVFSQIYGDCFRACMANLLELPIDVLPNDHSPNWFQNWLFYLKQFGLGLTIINAKGPLWAEYPWVANVKSKNFEKTGHCILMHNTYEVLFDPSTHKKYKKGEKLLGKNIVDSGYHLTIVDISNLSKLKEYQKTLTPLPSN